MKNKRNRSDIWKIVLENYDIPHITYGGLFCIIRRRELISWGEWHYLHDVMSKWEKAERKKPKDQRFDRWSAPLIKKFIKKLKDNENNG